ncbi:hypothetical protein DENSPDRAFT_846948 [Dentipellis sp. KUC8613]|nr:hypothetical protein DENSPDRAFT_846948 [Dentipellis sp. KUC8613]
MHTPALASPPRQPARSPSLDLPHLSQVHDSVASPSPLPQGKLFAASRRRATSRSINPPIISVHLTFRFAPRGHARRAPSRPLREAYWQSEHEKAEAWSAWAGARTDESGTRVGGWDTSEVARGRKAGWRSTSERGRMGREGGRGGARGAPGRRGTRGGEWDTRKGGWSARGGTDGTSERCRSGARAARAGRGGRQTAQATRRGGSLSEGHISGAGARGGANKAGRGQRGRGRTRMAPGRCGTREGRVGREKGGAGSDGASEATRGQLERGPLGYAKAL